MSTPTALPEWVVWVQALGPTGVSLVTALVAVAVGIIAYRQWTVANDKLVLDLFEKRYKVYKAVNDAVEATIHSGDADHNASIVPVAQARGEARLLFGEEVEAYLRTVQEKLAHLRLANTKIAALDNSQDWPEQALECNLWLLDFFDLFPKTLAPYMRMTQKQAHTPKERKA